MSLVQDYIDYIKTERRYSQRTVDIYSTILDEYYSSRAETDQELLDSFNPSELRSYQMSLIDDRGLSPKTVNLHFSVLSGFCNYLLKQGRLQSNPVNMIMRPKNRKRLPEFYKKDSMDEYFSITDCFTTIEELEAFLLAPFSKSGKSSYEKRLARLIVSILYSTGIRRAELIGLRMNSVDFSRKIVKISGKGDKMREIPLVDSLCEEILLYLKAVEALCGGKRSLKDPLLVTYRVKPLYPVYVDRVVKSELSNVKGIKGRQSPHILRHSLATELLNQGGDLNSIKEMLGHSSMATTQIYTHSSIAQLKNIYEQAHPRAKNGGKYGD